MSSNLQWRVLQRKYEEENIFYKNECLKEKKLLDDIEVAIQNYFQKFIKFQKFADKSFISQEKNISVDEIFITREIHKELENSTHYVQKMFQILNQNPTIVLKLIKEFNLKGNKNMDSFFLSYLNNFYYTLDQHLYDGGLQVVYLKFLVELLKFEINRIDRASLFLSETTTIKRLILSFLLRPENIFFSRCIMKEEIIRLVAEADNKKDITRVELSLEEMGLLIDKIMDLFINNVNLIPRVTSIFCKILYLLTKEKFSSLIEDSVFGATENLAQFLLYRWIMPQILIPEESYYSKHSTSLMLITKIVRLTFIGSYFLNPAELKYNVIVEKNMPKAYIFLKSFLCIDEIYLIEKLMKIDINELCKEKGPMEFQAFTYSKQNILTISLILKEYKQVSDEKNKKDIYKILGDLASTILFCNLEKETLSRETVETRESKYCLFIVNNVHEKYDINILLEELNPKVEGHIMKTDGSKVKTMVQQYLSSGGNIRNLEKYIASGLSDIKIDYQIKVKPEEMRLKFFLAIMKDKIRNIDAEFFGSIYKELEKENFQRWERFTQYQDQIKKLYIKLLVKFNEWEKELDNIKDDFSIREMKGKLLMFYETIALNTEFDEIFGVTQLVMNEGKQKKSFIRRSVDHLSSKKSKSYMSIEEFLQRFVEERNIRELLRIEKDLKLVGNDMFGINLNFREFLSNLVELSIEADKSLKKYKYELISNFLECLLTQRLHKMVLNNTPSKIDQRIQERRKVLNSVNMKEFRLPEGLRVEGAWEMIGEKLSKLADYDSTLEKITVLESFSKRIANVLKYLCKGEADDFIPVISYTLLKKCPPLMGSYINFLSLFSDPKNNKLFQGVCITQIIFGLTYILELGGKNLLYLSLTDNQINLIYEEENKIINRLRINESIGECPTIPKEDTTSSILEKQRGCRIF